MMATEINEKTRVPLGVVWLIVGSVVAGYGWMYGLKAHQDQHEAVDAEVRKALDKDQHAQDARISDNERHQAELQQQMVANTQAFSKAAELQVKLMEQNNALLQMALGRRDATPGR